MLLCFWTLNHSKVLESDFIPDPEQSLSRVCARTSIIRFRHFTNEKVYVMAHAQVLGPDSYHCIVQRLYPAAFMALRQSRNAGNDKAIIFHFSPNLIVQWKISYREGGHAIQFSCKIKYYQISVNKQCHDCGRRRRRHHCRHCSCLYSCCCRRCCHCRGHRHAIFC